jgi:hypothetical protein
MQCPYCNTQMEFVPRLICYKYIGKQYYCSNCDEYFKADDDILDQEE